MDFGDAFSMVTTDAIHSIDTFTPIHHPHIWNNCVNQHGCAVNVTTVSDTIFEGFDERTEMRSPFISAREIKVKFKSIQSIIEVTVDPDASKLDLKKTDPDTLCRDMNKYALKTARTFMPPDRLAMYDQYGPEIVFENDMVVGMMEPLWSKTVLKMEVDAHSRNLVVGAGAFLTSVNMQWKNITLMAGLHYCKLASPARFVEIMLTDGLRNRFGYRNAKDREMNLL